MQHFVTLPNTTQMLNLAQGSLCICMEQVVQQARGTGKWQKYLLQLNQIFTDIRVLKVMNMCQIITLYISLKTTIMERKKLLLHWNLELVVIGLTIALGGPRSVTIHSLHWCTYGHCLYQCCTF